MNLDLSGKVALVTGSSKGIGRSIAEALHSEGCRVALNGRDTDDLAVAVSQLNGAIGIDGDVTKPMAARDVIGRVISAFGGLDILVCNVGSGRSVAPGDETPEEWHRMFALNLWSATNMVEAARDALAESNGSIVCISSICGLEAIPGAPVTYSAAKAALHAYIRGMANPLGKIGVRINGIAPGNMLFDGSVWQEKLEKDRDAVQQILDKDVALGRLGAPGDIASLVAYLVSARAAFTTGAIWTLDGGQVRS